MKTQLTIFAMLNNEFLIKSQNFSKCVKLMTTGTASSARGQKSNQEILNFVHLLTFQNLTWQYIMT